MEGGLWKVEGERWKVVGKNQEKGGGKQDAYVYVLALRRGGKRKVEGEKRKREK